MVVDVERCHIATDGINEALPPAREAARHRVQEAFASGQGQRIGKRGATLLFRETTEEGTVTDNNADVSERVNGMVFNFKVGVHGTGSLYALIRVSPYSSVANNHNRLCWPITPAFDYVQICLADILFYLPYKQIFLSDT